MGIIENWKAYLGPKDERLVSESNRFMRVGYYILLAGALICSYYGLMLEQVSDVTEHPIYTALGTGLFKPYELLLCVVLLSCIVATALELKAGIFSDRSRLASVDRVPWGYVTLLSLLVASVLFVLTVALRIAAEIQIVGLGAVTWGGDLAIGVVYFILGFLLSLGAFYGQIRSAITRRRELEAECDE